MTDRIVGGLRTQATVESRVESGAAPAWVRAHWNSFREGLLGRRNDTPFPCFFGAESVANGDPLYTAVPSTTDAGALLGLGETLLEYLDVRTDHSDRASLVAFFRPPDRTLTEAEYHDTLWHILQFLHVHDPEPWPEDIPTEPDDPHWEFCFGGEPMFPTCRAPFYDDRKSRFCPIGLEITFQPRALFEELGVTADRAAGQHARDVIQERLESYDGVCPHADLGDWGVEGDREWPQYMLASDDAQAPSSCPITVTREHPKSDRLLGERRSAGSHV
ncbi:YcgG family protein [Natronomonas moolapensis 8.8.11]|uniref:YcgG family protein n=1 Tax=Natronomonas moolapensis (strain DSM 18674 / CECT 7526 / JCM 14361 / 8.8.11) TaxID=268739 RepID=M1Y3S9_NATM8|nr:YqcI/YcgG family protein [Natronomonas moolapensis]CCQ37181.1 YcgG family protein [Natronomonas moolapensis 8.8.11]